MFTRYTPETLHNEDGEITWQPDPGVLYLQDENGNDWYDAQKTFAADTWKIQHNAMGYIQRAEKDASLLFPENASVIESNEAPLDGATVVNGLLQQPSQASILQSQRDFVWQQIKAKREEVRHGGVRVTVSGESGDKFFHTDESSRLQYLTLSGLPQLPPNLQWKTMDNTFVAMTPELLQSVVTAAIVAEQTDFAVAEQHRLAVEQSDTPLDYDFSTGWSETYADTL